MKNKIVLITGASGGIGYQTALGLSRLGARVVITGRAREAAEKAAAEIEQESGTAVDYLLADLSTQTGVRALVGQFESRYPHLNVLINNAGLAAPRRDITADGLEAMFAVNVVAPFLLTHLLMPVLKNAGDARVISLTGGDLPAVLDLENLQAERSFNGLNAYSQSKVAMMAVMYEFARRTGGSPASINVCYPGQASTAMTRGVTPEMLPGPMRLLFPLFKLAVRDDGGKSARKASRSSVYLASSPEVQGVNGRYYNTDSKPAAWPAAVLDEHVRARVWSVTAQAAGEF